MYRILAADLHAFHWGQPTPVEDEDPISMQKGRKSMGNDQRGPIPAGKTS